MNSIKYIFVLFLLNPGVGVSEKCSNSFSPRKQYYEYMLRLASDRGYVKTVKKMLKKKINIDAQNKEGQTALHRASDKNHPEIVSLLLENKANVDIQDKNGATALHLASKGDYLEVAELLLQGGANMDIQDENGATALHFAVWQEHKKMEALLLKEREGVYLHGQTSGADLLQLVKDLGHKKVEELLKRQLGKL